MRRRVVPKDFDDPEIRTLPLPSLASLWSPEARRLYGEPADVHPEIARRLDREGLSPVLDIGCGDGALARTLRGGWVGLDRSLGRLRGAVGARVRADAERLPFGDGVFGAAAALYVLYFFEDPVRVAAEARRVLRPGGLFAVCSPSRDDAPELAQVVPPEPDVFASEDIPELLRDLFEDVEITTWDAPLFLLRDHDAVRDYLYSWYWPRFTRAEAERRARLLETPVKITKRGAWAVGRRPA